MEEIFLNIVDGDSLSRVRTEQVEGVNVYWATPSGWDHADPRLVVDIHGGGFFLMGGNGARLLAAMWADRLELPIAAIDYRMPPDHPFPAGLEDCVTVYQHLLESRRPEDIVIEGSSAGGNLAAAMILQARELALPLPAGAVLLTPEVDLTESGDTFATLEGIDPVLQSLMQPNLLYAAGRPLDDPYLSPLYANFTNGFPRTFIQSGTRDLFLSNSVNLHRALRRAKVEAHLHVWEAMPHAGFQGSPEDAELDAEVRKFIAQCWT